VRVDTLANRATERSSFASMIDPASPPPLDVDPPSPAVSAFVDHDARVGMPSVVDPCALHRPSGSSSKVVVVVVKLLSRTLTAFMIGIVVINPPRVPPIDDDDHKEDETTIALLNRIAFVAIVIAVARRPSNGARSPVQFQKK
jgi:hypothetical protein